MSLQDTPIEVGKSLTTKNEQTSEVQEGDKSTLVIEEVEKTETTTDPDVPVTLSKNARKRLLKDQKWEANRGLRAEKRKQKKKQAKANKRELERQADPDAPVLPNKKKFKLMSEAKETHRVVIDADWEGFMTDGDLKKVAKQAQRCYSVNRRSEEPLQYYITSIGPRLQGLLDKEPDYKGWDIKMSAESYLDVFKKEELVYLTSDSPNVLKELDTDKVYIIGGLVDHNHHKGVAYQRAIDQGIAHAQLPIGDYIKLASRKVLTINHVYEILLEWVNTRDWQKAFLNVIPQRKGVEVISENDDTGSGNTDDIKMNLTVEEGKSEEGKAEEDKSEEGKSEKEKDRI